MLPTTTRRSRVLTAGLGLALLSATTLTPVAHAAPAAPAVLTASGPYAGDAGTELLTVNAVDLSDNPNAALTLLLSQVVTLLGLPGDLSVADLGLAHTEASADSDGGANGVPDNRTQGRAANIFPDSVASSISLGGLLSDVEAVAPPSSTASDDLLDITAPNPLAALVDLEVSGASATANWVSDTECVAADTPLSVGDIDTADATVIGAVPGGGLVNTGNGVTSLTSTTDLPATGGPNDQRAIRATSSTELTEINIGGGALELGVVTPATLVASATGIDGGASLTYTPPTVVNLADNAVLTADDLEALIEGALGPVFTLINGLGLLTIDARVQTAFTTPGSADGTTASGSTAFITIRIDLLGTELLTLEVLPARASVTAPAGGIFCGNPVDDSNPLELQKVNSGPAVPGSSFDYSIAVGNTGDCTLDPVSVVDTLLGPAGSEVILTEPGGATVTPISGGFRIEWANVGPIAPDGRTTLRIRVSVPAGATVGDRYTDTVTSTGTVVSGPGCTERDVSRTVTLNEPEVVGRPSGNCNITGSTKSKSHLEVYPGESFVYFVNVLNGGGTPCTNVTVTDAVDSRLTFEACSDNCSFSSPNITWNLGTLQPGQSVTLRVQVKVNAGATGQLANVALIDTDQTDPHTVRVSGPDITTNSILSPGDPARIPNTTLSRTGGTVPVGLGLGLGLVGLLAWRVRRRAVLI